MNIVTKEITATATRANDIKPYNFDLMGIGGDWTDGKLMQFDEERAVSLVSVSLKAGDHAFKLRDHDNTDTWFGDGQEFFRTYDAHSDVLARNGSDMVLHADVDGEYIFIYNFYLGKMKVSYPAIVPAKKIAALNGAFSINKDGEQINFSRGNLQYNYGEDEWYAAEKQYDMLGFSNLRFGDAAYEGSIVFELRFVYPK